MTQLGRISGPLLKDDLLRDGVDLAFEGNLLYLDVNTNKIGINTDIPGRDLEVNDTIRTTNLIVDTQSEIAHFTISTNQFQTALNPISFVPDQTTDPKVRVAGTLTNNVFNFTVAKVENTVADSDIELSPATGGITHFTSEKVNVNGNLHATGDITWDGDIVFGDDNNDNVSFAAEIDSNIVPDITNEYDLGSPSQEWGTLYSHNVEATNFTVADSVIADSTQLLTTQGAIRYVTTTGNDTNHGTHPHSPFLTLKKALSVSTAGDTVYIYPGEYLEEFPLTVPAGVTVKGTSLRTVTIMPTEATNSNDGFLLNGETTVADITVKGFYYDPFADTGYGFRFAPGFKITTRSPYVQNVTVITEAP